MNSPKRSQFFQDALTYGAFLVRSELAFGEEISPVIFGDTLEVQLAAHSSRGNCALGVSSENAGRVAQAQLSQRPPDGDGMYGPRPHIRLLREFDRHHSGR